jgi:hypothetical protein
MIPTLSAEDGGKGAAETEFLSSLDSKVEPNDGVDFFTSSTNTHDFIMHTKSANLLLDGFASNINKTTSHKEEDLFDDSHHTTTHVGSETRNNNTNTDDLLVDLDNSRMSDFFENNNTNANNNNDDGGIASQNLLQENCTNVILNGECIKNFMILKSRFSYQTIQICLVKKL